MAYNMDVVIKGARKRYRLILRRLQTGSTQSELAREFGISRQRMSQLVEQARKAKP